MNVMNYALITPIYLCAVFSRDAELVISDKAYTIVSNNSVLDSKVIMVGDTSHS